jgi:hypothetical protein
VDVTFRVSKALGLYVPQYPQVTSISPHTVAFGELAKLVIYGRWFGSSADDIASICIGGVEARITAFDSTGHNHRVSVELPAVAAPDYAQDVPLQDRMQHSAVVVQSRLTGAAGISAVKLRHAVQGAFIHSSVSYEYLSDSMSHHFIQAISLSTRNTRLETQLQRRAMVGHIGSSEAW